MYGFSRAKGALPNLLQYLLERNVKVTQPAGTNKNNTYS